MSRLRNAKGRPDLKLTQVSGGGGLSRVDVSDDNDVDVSLIFTHFEKVVL